MKLRLILFFIVGLSLAGVVAAQTRRRPRPPAPRPSAAKYSEFLHFSNRHKSLECKGCHKIPTAWTANRVFPDVADFPDHDACVRCHRPQFFMRQAVVGSGPAMCTVCHVRSAPREDRRFAFGKPNNSNQPVKSKDERQFKIEFPHDKHQNVIAWQPRRDPVRWVRASFAKTSLADEGKPDYNNCSICHQQNSSLAASSSPPPNDPGTLYLFKTMPRSHDACFGCHWKQEPVGSNCSGCHKASERFVALDTPRRISARFAHDGGKGEHVLECTTCHINITRASTVRTSTPDVPINACAACHRDSRKTTYPKAVTIETEMEQFKTTGNCTYCHIPEIGRKRPPPSHESAVQ